MILLSIELEALTMSDIVTAFAVLIVIWKGFEEVGKMLEKITARHDREKGWDTAVKQIREERQSIVNMFSKRLTEVEQSIEEAHADSEAKIQEVRAEQMFIIECLRAVLDGLGQLNCNGVVTETKHKLDNYLNTRAHE